MKKIIIFILIINLLGVFVVGCANSSETQTDKSVEKIDVEESKENKETKGWPRTIEDSANHKVILNKKPKRITLLHTYFMEHFFALGVPVTASALGNSMGYMESLEESEMFRPYLKDSDIMNLGSAREINLEAILESKPDVIVTFKSQKGLDKTYEQLVKIAPVILLDHTETWQNQLSRCAEIVGKETEVDNVIKEIEDKIKQAKSELKKYNDRTFALFRTNGKEFLTRANEEYYEKFGIKNPKGYPFGYNPVSIEAVAEMNPYYIVFQHNLKHAKTFVESLEESKVWKSLDAVKNNRIYYFDENMNTFGPLALKLTAEKLTKIYGGK
ncbi:ABC transporter substrate-binding protein [Clostridiaceae bacterium M8S5]|nr:ABC transporter substrate-binding protein [Clostridiaceae bacterium M8S5]